jgi:hypothetical protein
MSIPTPGRMFYLAVRRAKLGLRHGYVERFIEPRILQWRLDPKWPAATVPIHLLASKRDWNLALWMLASFHHFTARRWPVTLHEDGSLGDEELAVFRRLFPDLQVIRRANADAIMVPLLSDYPRCAAYRQAMPHGLKSFDIPQMSTSDRFLLLDPDVLFFDTPTEILRWAENPSDRSCWFNRDCQEASPIPPDQARAELGVALWPQVNSGLCLLTRDAVTDLKAMEAWLGHPAFQNASIQWRVEQTLFALAASRFGQGGLLPSTYEVSPYRHRQSGCIARHYVGCVRDRFLSEGIWNISAKVLYT